MNTARIRIIATAAALAVAGLSVPATAQVQSNIVNSAERTGTSSASSSRSAEAPRICVRSEITGSRLRRTVCHTRTEWESLGGIPND